MTYEELPPAAQILFWVLFLLPALAHWLGDLTGAWIRRRYDRWKAGKKQA